MEGGFIEVRKIFYNRAKRRSSILVTEIMSVGNTHGGSFKRCLHIDIQTLLKLRAFRKRSKDQDDGNTQRK